NNRAELAVLDRVLRDRARRAWMLAGVTMVAPETVFLDEAVRLGRDVTLHPGVHLRGATSVAEGAVVGPYAVLTDCRVEAGAVVPAHTVATGETFAAEWARSRPTGRVRVVAARYAHMFAAAGRPAHLSAAA